MIDVDQLNDLYCVEGELGFSEMDGGLVFANVSNKYGDADICLYGAQATYFAPHGRYPILWLSPECIYEEGKAIRGGIPICFPWFGPHPTDSTKPQHGFGRLRYWSVKRSGTTEHGETFLILQLVDDEQTRALWDYSFCAEITFIVGKKLTVDFKVTNTDTKPFTYSEALHSYFSVSNSAEISVEGLQGTHFYDGFGDELIQDNEPVITFDEGELNRRYVATHDACVINDEPLRRHIRVGKSGSSVTVVWNPSKEICEKAADFSDDSFEEFVCVEAANSYNHSIELAPGDEHILSTEIGLLEKIVE